MFRSRPCGRGSEASAGTLPDEVALELSQRPEDVEGEPTRGRGGVDGLGERAEAHAPCLQFGDTLQEMRHGASQAIELSDNKGVTLTQVSIRTRSLGLRP